MRSILFAVLVLSASFTAGFALPGDLDLTFGVQGGYYVSDFLGTGFNESINDVLVQPDGKIVIAGSVRPSANVTDFLVARFNTDGTLDTSFSGDGIFTLDQGGLDEVHALAIQSDGKIVAVGEYGSTTANMVFRLLSNGSLDTAFGGGTGKIQILTAGRALSVAIQPADEKIVVGGYTNLNVATICRLNTNGFLDTTFDTDGIALFTQMGRASGVGVQANGRIVFAGYAGSDTAVARVLSNGSIDSSYGTSGVVTTPVLTGFDEAVALIIQSDGKIVISGGGDAIDGGAFLVRYNTNGTLDSGFDGDGIRTYVININGDNFFDDVVEQSNGRLVAVGYVTYGIQNTLQRYDFTLARFNSDGSFDNSFDANGITESQWCERGSGLALQSDGTIVAVGIENAESARGTCTQRFNADGSVDPTFNQSASTGKTTLDFVKVEAVKGLPNGKIMVAGWDTQQYDIATLVRLNANGSLDTTFADEGVFQYFNGLATSTYFYDLEVLNDGSVLVAGEGGTSPGAIVFKFDPAGNPDTTFSGDGLTSTSSVGRFYSIAVQSDGKIFGCGSNGFGLSTRQGRGVRISATGTVETSFSNLFNTGGSNDSEILDCEFQSDGKLVVAGYSNDGVSDRLAISRHLTTLAVETTGFGIGGYVINDLSAALNDRATDLVVQPDDKILVSSTALNGSGDRDFAVLRFTANGSPDLNFMENFGTNGISLIDFVIGNPNDDANALLLQPDGQFLVAGSTSSTTETRFGLAKLNPGGAPTLGWGTLGRTTAPFSGDDASAYAMSFYSNDRILVAGRAWNGTNYDFALARFQNELILTAANESISGRVSTQKGSGIANVVVTATNSSGEIRTARTNSFGFYRFDDMPTGETYVITATSKRFQFNEPSRVVLLNEAALDIDFVANP